MSSFSLFPPRGRAPGRVKAGVFILAAVALIVADTTGTELVALRQGIGNLLHPLQQVVAVPWKALTGVREDLSDLTRLRTENAELHRIEALNAKALLEQESLAQENRRLRELAGMRERVSAHSLLAQVLYETGDAYSRRVVLDRGINDGVRTGMPVIDTLGLVGQVTRVFQFNSEVTQITDSDATVPVQNRRTGQRAVLYGTIHPGTLALRFMPRGSDLRAGDELVTSGLDALFPPGLAVGVVETVAEGSGDFLDVPVKPAAGVYSSSLLVVLQVDTRGIPALSPEAVRELRGGRHRREGS